VRKAEVLHSQKGAGCRLVVSGVSGQFSGKKRGGAATVRAVEWPAHGLLRGGRRGQRYDLSAIVKWPESLGGLGGGAGRPAEGLFQGVSLLGGFLISVKFFPPGAIPCLLLKICQREV